jgi:hypothetical protein
MQAEPAYAAERLFAAVREREICKRAGRRIWRKKYNVYVTDKRLILYARRGLVMRSDDIVSERLESIHGVKYRETGFPFKTATISVWGTSTIDMKGPASRIKPLFHSLQSMVNNQ